MYHSLVSTPPFVDMTTQSTVGFVVILLVTGGSVTRVKGFFPFFFSPHSYLTASLKSFVKPNQVGLQELKPPGKDGGDQGANIRVSLALSEPAQTAEMH